MQGNAFQGAFFAASPLMEQADLDEQGLFEAIDRQLRAQVRRQGRAGRAGQPAGGAARLRRDAGDHRQAHGRGHGRAAGARPPACRSCSSSCPRRDGGITDVHRFWEQTGSFYATGKGEENLADPYIGLSLIPASTGVFRDMTQIRFEYPRYVAENCTACGDCFTVCPDSAIPGLVNSVAEVFETAISRIERKQQPTRYLRRAVREVEKRLRAADRTARGMPPTSVSAWTGRCWRPWPRPSWKARTRRAWSRSSAGSWTTIGDFQFAITKPYYSNREKKAEGQRRAVLHHHQSLHLQGLHGVRRGLRRRRPGADPQTAGGDRDPAPGLGLLAGPAHHPAGLHPHRRPGRAHRRAGDPAAGQEELRLHGLRRRCLHGLRGEDPSFTCSPPR